MAKNSTKVNVKSTHIKNRDSHHGTNADRFMENEEVKNALKYVKAGQITEDTLRAYGIKHLE